MAPLPRWCGGTGLNPSFHPPLLHLALFLSGAAALVYETVWFKWLGLALGTTVHANLAVYAAFMAGLAGGAWLGRRWFVRKPAQRYARLELAIAASGPLTALLLRELPGLFPHIPGFSTSAPAIALTFRLLACLLLTTPAAALIGATFPALAAFAGTARRTTLAGLYAVNLAGALTGVAVAAYWWIGALGLTRTSLWAAVLNALAAGAAWLYRRQPAAATSLISQPVAAAGRKRCLPVVAAALAGAAGGACQLLWTRALVVQFHSTVHAYAAVLLVCLAALGLGSALVRRPAGQPRCDTWLAAMLAANGVAVWWSGAALGWLPDWAATLFPHARSFGHIALAQGMLAAAVIFPAALASGTVLPLAIGTGHAARAGPLYAANTLGAIAGALLAAFLLIPLSGVAESLSRIASVLALTGLLWLTARENRWDRRALPAGLLVVWLCGRFGQRNQELHLLPAALHLAGSRVEVLHHREGIASTVTVIRDRRDRQRHLYIDGFEAAGGGVGYAYMRVLGRLPLVLRPDAREVLVIGAGTGTTAGSVAKASRARVTVAEIDPGVVAALPRFERQNRGLLQAPRVRIVREDGRQLLLRERTRYDAILLEPMPPHFAGTVNLYSRQFYALARRQLAEAGIVGQWLPLHLMPPDILAMLLKTFAASFPETIVWLDETAPIALLFGSRQPFVLREDALPGGRADLTELARAIVATGQPALAATAAAPLLEDDRPVLEYRGARTMAGDAAGSHAVANRAFLLRLSGQVQRRFRLQDGKLVVDFR